MKKDSVDLKKTITEIFIKISIAVLPLLLALSFLIDSAYRYQVEKSKKNILAEISNKTDVFEKTIQSLFQEVFQDVFIIENANEFEYFIQNQSYKNRMEALGLFSRYMKNKEDYLQLRFIGIEGKELIRVDRINDQVTVTPDEKLQQKKDRPYFINSIRSGKEGIYISNLDLNIEFGKIIEPYVPVIRFSKPVKDSKGKAIGVIVINYDGQRFINSFKDYLGVNRDLIELYLTDNNGYYLSNEDSDKNFGFMFRGESLDYTVKKEIPELWNEIIKNSEKTVEIKDRIFYFKKLMPTFRGSVYFEDKNYYWNILTSIKEQNIPKMFPEQFLFQKNTKFYILFTVFLISSIIITILHLKKKESDQLYLTKMILSYVDEAVLITDSRRNIVGLNEGFTKLTGYSREELLNLNTKIFNYSEIHPKLYEKIKKQLLEGLDWKGELWFRKKDNSKYPVFLTINNIINPKNRSTDYYVSVIRDLSAEKEKAAETEYLLTHNSKTNLPNEFMFYSLINEEIKKENEFGILYIKLKKFDNLQMKYSEDFLDLIYQEIVEKLTSFAGKDGNIAHLSRDVFIAILKLPDEKISMNRSLTELSSRLKSNMKIGDKDINLKFDFGAVFFPEHGNSPKDLLRKAMFSVKALKYYPDRSFLIYQDSLEKKIQRELDIEEHLPLAIKNNELEVYFQPQMDSEKDLLVGAEALLRWNSRVLGSVSPAEFIPIAENIGVINKLGMWVVNEVARLTKILGIDKHKNIKISINLSATDFKNEFLVEEITYILEVHGLDFSQFEIELTEGVLVDDYDYVKPKLDEFQMNGISVAIDDFGTGFSSMTHLKKLKFDKIKIDRSFIKDYPESDNGSIAEIITYLAKKLDITVIAEGAETEEQVEYLRGIGCSRIQGYYYSKPLSSSDFKEYMNSHFMSKKNL
ncbi:EAL domain-containing protein [uncultured Ilyobacter sp.]|uniref:bifunctional diguanylate cyclase/phosphodiesterase n=1 Tax=uncultured Ilyobacter sp. TaxID=544433 RepID=UPI0029F5CC6A|nr:EAL domain-containing protein [uncultured Ilyobacter sp.]